jgi:hypothetical protein
MRLILVWLLSRLENQGRACHPARILRRQILKLHKLLLIGRMEDLMLEKA